MSQFAFYFTFDFKKPTGSPLPVPVPQHVKNRLIALCKDVAFSVRCSLCHNVLISHQAAQAHFKYVLFLFCFFLQHLNVVKPLYIYFTDCIQILYETHFYGPCPSFSSF